MITELIKKVKFVNEISKAVTKVQDNVTSIRYRVFKSLTHEGWEKEYLVINYKGGARTVRVCTGNSCSAIFEEIAKYLEHGYYSEERDLVNLEYHTEEWQEEVIE